MITLTHDGDQYANWEAEELLAAGVPQDAIDLALAAQISGNQKQLIRGKIARDAGDALSLLGTTSDAATIAVLVSACFMASLDEDTGYAAFRTKANALMKSISGDHDPTEIARAFLENVGSGAIRLPALEKGIVAVLQEVTERGNAVSNVLNPLEPQA